MSTDPVTEWLSGLVKEQEEEIASLKAEIKRLSAKPAEKETVSCLECARLKETTTRLYDENRGLHDRINKGDRRQDERIERLEQERDEWKDKYFKDAELKSDLDSFFLDRYQYCRERVMKDAEHLEQWRLLEAEVEMHRRARGTGRGRGRNAEWTPFQAGQVKEAHAAGHSLRQISRHVGVTVSQVRTILDRPADQPHPDTERNERFVKRLQEIEQFIKGAKAQVAEYDKRARRAQKTRPRQSAT